MIVFLLATLAVMAYLITDFNVNKQTAARVEQAGGDLLAAKEALLAFNYGQSGDARDPDKMSLGRLPLPDMGRRGISDANLANDHEGESAGVGLAGNAVDTVLIGRLPWKTLGLRTLRDEAGECLWYGLSAAWKNTNNQPSTDPLRYLPPGYNWDNLGDFDLYDAQLQKISADPHRNRAVAVVFAPGPPLPGQNRAPAAPPVAGEFVSRCGGNYDARNYLDPPDLTAATGNRFNAFSTQVASTHEDYSADPAARNSMSASPPALPKNVLAQPIGTQSAGAPVAITNDRIVAITNDEIFAQLLTQTHSLGVPAKLNELLGQLKTCLETPNASGELVSTGLVALGSKKVGKFDPAIACAGAPELDRWRDNLWYAMIPKANAPTKINTSCDGVLVFSGTRGGAQRRSNAAEKAAAASYLESALPVFTDMATLAFVAPSAFGLAGNPPSTDVAICLTHPTALAYNVDVGNMSDRLAVNPSGQTLLRRDVATQTITLGNPAAASGSFGNASAVACSWYTNSIPFGSGIRIYFNFRYTFYDAASTTPVGPGFTFALVDADTNGTDVCGGSVPNGSTNRGQLMGYAGVMKDASSNVISTISPPKMAVEFDTANNADRNDTTSSHVGVVYWGVKDSDGDNNLDDDGDGFVDQPDADDDNKHAIPATPQSRVTPITQPDPINDSAFGYPCLRSAFAAGTCNDLDVPDRVFHVRIDITRSYSGVDGRSAYYHRIWINQTKLADMDNLNSDFKDFPSSPSPDLENRDQSVPLDGIKDDVFVYDSVYAGLPTVVSGEAFRLLRFGFTIAQPTRREEVVVSNLAVKSR